MSHTSTHPLDYDRKVVIVSQPTRLCKACGGNVYPNLHTGALECLSCEGAEWEWVEENDAEEYRAYLRTTTESEAGELAQIIDACNAGYRHNRTVGKFTEPSERKAQADIITARYKAEFMTLPLSPTGMTAADEDGCGNDADLHDLAIGR